MAFVPIRFQTRRQRAVSLRTRRGNNVPNRYLTRNQRMAMSRGRRSPRRGYSRRY